MEGFSSPRFAGRNEYDSIVRLEAAPTDNPVDGWASGFRKARLGLGVTLGKVNSDRDPGGKHHSFFDVHRLAFAAVEHLSWGREECLSTSPFNTQRPNPDD